MTWQHFFTDGLLCQCQPKLTGLQSHILIGVLSSLQHVLQEKTHEIKSGSIDFKKDRRGKRHDWKFHERCVLNILHILAQENRLRMTTWMMLCIWGMRRSMRTSSNMTRALHTFLRTSESSSAASANRLWWKTEENITMTSWKSHTICYRNTPL